MRGFASHIRGDFLEDYSRDLVVPKDIVVRFFDYVEQNGYLKIFIRWLWGKMIMVGGLGALQFFDHLKRALEP